MAKSRWSPRKAGRRSPEINSGILKLAKLGAETLNRLEDPQGGDFEAHSIFDCAIQLGLYEGKEARKPCSPTCLCEELGFFPRTCIRITQEAKRTIRYLTRR